MKNPLHREITDDEIEAFQKDRVRRIQYLVEEDIAHPSGMVKSIDRTMALFRPSSNPETAQFIMDCYCMAPNPTS